MSIGERLLELRKEKHLSQEEAAEKLNVSRQTISKWETNQSTPDFDKIASICELYEISADELINGKEQVAKETNQNEEDVQRKKAYGIGMGILGYFIAVVWIMISIPVLKINPIVASAIFLLICGIATFIIVYTCMIYKLPKKREEKNMKLVKQINQIISSIFLVIYLLVSFITLAWHITWILWVVCGLVEEIVKLIFLLRGNENEE